jgi:hypothetical protein
MMFPSFLRISDFGPLSDFGLRASDFKPFSAFSAFSAPLREPESGSHLPQGFSLHFRKLFSYVRSSESRTGRLLETLLP